MRTSDHQPGPSPRTVQRPRHVQDNSYIGPARDPEVLEIWGYTDRYTYHPGEVIALRISTTAKHYDIEIGRDGLDYTPVLHLQNRPGQHHDTPVDCSVNGCDWPVTDEITVPADWPSGGI